MVLVNVYGDWYFNWFDGVIWVWVLLLLIVRVL